MFNRCNIYPILSPVAGTRWRVQQGYNVIGTYKTLRGAKIAATKQGYVYTIRSGYGN